MAVCHQQAQVDGTSTKASSFHWVVLRAALSVSLVQHIQIQQRSLRIELTYNLFTPNNGKLSANSPKYTMQKGSHRNIQRKNVQKCCNERLPIMK